MTPAPSNPNLTELADRLDAHADDPVMNTRRGDALCREAAAALRSQSEARALALGMEAKGSSAVWVKRGYEAGLEEAAKAINKKMRDVCSDPEIYYIEPDTGAAIIVKGWQEYVEALDDAEAIVRALVSHPAGGEAQTVAEVAAMRAQLESARASYAISEAQHALGAREGEQLVDAAYRVAAELSALRAQVQTLTAENQRFRNGFANLYQALQDAPGLPIEALGEEDQAKWTDLITGLMMALGGLEMDGRPMSVWEALQDAARGGK